MLSDWGIRSIHFSVNFCIAQNRKKGSKDFLVCPHATSRPQNLHIGTVKNSEKINNPSMGRKKEETLRRMAEEDPSPGQTAVDVQFLQQKVLKY